MLVIVGQSLWCYEVLELSALILQKTFGSWFSRRRSLLHHRPQKHLWQEQQDLHPQLGDSTVGPSEELQGVAEEIVEVNVDEKEVIGSPKTPNKDAITIVKVVAEEDVTNPSELKEEKSALKFQLVTRITLNILPDQQG